MGCYKHYYDSEEELYETFMNSVNSGNCHTSFDEERMTSINDWYEEWKFDTFRHSKDDYDWDSDYHDDDIYDDDDE